MTWFPRIKTNGDLRPYEHQVSVFRLRRSPSEPCQRPKVEFNNLASTTPIWKSRVMRMSDSETTEATDQQTAAVYSRRRVLSIGTSSIALAASMGLWAYPRPASAEVGNQSDWRACEQCDALFFDGYSTKGVCPLVGGQHVTFRGANAAVYSFHYDTQKLGSNVQYDWRFCNKCFAMFWDGDPNKGRCAAGGGHVAQGYMFGLSIANVPSAADVHFCRKCHVALEPSFVPHVCAGRREARTARLHVSRPRR